MTKNLPKAIIFDLDGTLTNYHHRAHHLLPPNRDMFAFFDLMEDDTQHDWCRHILDEALRSGTRIIFLTGRPDSYRAHTERWLAKYGITPSDYDVLLMREAEDFRSGAIVKAEIFNMEIRGKYDVLYAVDDNPLIAKMWTELGIRCLYCGTAEDYHNNNDVTP